MSGLIFPVIFIVIGVFLLALFLIRRVKYGCDPWTTVSKSMVSVGFMCVAVAAIVTNAERFDAADLRYSAFIISGLLFGLLGDIWLDLKYAHADSGIPYTYAGFITFLFGHLVYDAGLIYRFYIPGNPLYLIVPAVIAVALIFVMAFTENLLQVKYGKFKPIVLAYTPVVASISLLSGSLAILNGFRCVPVDIYFFASLSFLISDFILNGTYFGQGKDKPVYVITNHVSYYAAQYAIALSLCFLK